MGDKIRLMSHLVAGYPTNDLAFRAASALVKGGTDILEIQLPFSDPSADGPVIQTACTHVLERGYKVADGLAFISRLRKTFPNVTIYIMSYGSLVYTPGVDNFCKKAADAGVNGMIIPDLPFDNDEGLTESCQKYGMENIPVAAPGMAPERMDKLTHAGYKHIYTALRTGITGKQTQIDSRTLEFLKKVQIGGSKVYGGFGIYTGEQAAALASSVDAIVAGSVFVKIIARSYYTPSLMELEIEEKARELSHI